MGEFVKVVREMEVKKGRGVWWMVKMNGKKWIIREVEKFVDESEENVEERFGK